MGKARPVRGSGAESGARCGVCRVCSVPSPLHTTLLVDILLQGRGCAGGRGMDGSDAQQEGRKPPSTKAAGPTFAVMFCIPAESKAPAEPVGPWNPIYPHAEKSQGVGINTEINHRCIQCPESVRSATGALTRLREMGEDKITEPTPGKPRFQSAEAQLGCTKPRANGSCEQQR